MIRKGALLVITIMAAFAVGWFVGSTLAILLHS